MTWPTEFFRWAGLLVLLVLLSACGGSRWYKDDAGQAAFNRDAAECERFAENYARDHTVSGTKRNLELYIKAYNDCLFDKGWSHIQPQAKAQAQDEARAEEALGSYANGTLQVFNLRLPLPANSTLVRRNSGVFGPLQQTTWFFALPDGRYANYIVQKNLTLGFEREAFPISKPYFVYERGQENYGEKGALDWALFCGPVDSEWVGGWGGYVFIDSKHRIVLTITQTLPQPQSEPPEGLRLTQAQYQAMEHFLERVRGLLPEASLRAEKPDEPAVTILPRETFN